MVYSKYNKMKITLENIEQIPEEERMLVKALLKDLEEVNNKSLIQLYINWQEWHDNYSPERVDPCPDYYGYYTIRLESNPSEFIGVQMTLRELDEAMCLLCNYVELCQEKSF